MTGRCSTPHQTQGTLFRFDLFPDFLHQHLHSDIPCLGDLDTECLPVTAYRNRLLKARRLQEDNLNSFFRRWQLEYLSELPQHHVRVRTSTCD